MMNGQTLEYIKQAKSGKYDVCIWGAGYIGTGTGLQLLKKRGIIINYYCDNNPSFWGKEIVDGILCISPDELKNRSKKVICFLLVGVLNIKSVLQQIKHIGIQKIVIYNDLFIEEMPEYFPFMKRNKTVIYTCIVDGYDNLEEPLSISSECDYFIITDKKPEQETIFKYININEYLPEHITDNTRKNRYCKINAHKIFPQYKYSIYFDGNIKLKNSITEFINDLPRTRITAFCPNFWDSIYREMMSVMQNKRDDEKRILKQAEKYWMEGMPEDFGCIMCGILIREHNNPICKNIMEEWWEQIELFSKRDQISLPYVLWKNNYSISDIGLIADQYMDGKHWEFKKEHNRPRIQR